MPVLDDLTLREVLSTSFDKNELNLLCADITEALNHDGISQRVDLEIVGGDTLETHGLNLIKYMERRGLLSYLKEAVNKERPKLLQNGKG
jgi:Effector-associated domain 7